MVQTSDGEGSDAQSITQMIRSEKAIIVTVINLKNDGGINDPECAVGANLHWKINPHTVSNIVVTIPSDFGSVVDKFEVRNGEIHEMSSLTNSSMVSSKLLGVDHYGVEIFGDTLAIANVKMSSDLSTRLFVLANDKSVRSNVQKNL